MPHTKFQPPELDANSVLNDLVLPSRANQTWPYSGFDSPENAVDLAAFENYAHPVQYKFNSRGFRDQEWPADLQGVIWCVGDSFTLGMGAPETHTWPHCLSQLTGRRCINVSMDGASNDWIRRRALQIWHELEPDWICVQWSFLHRRENPDTDLTDEDRRIWNVFATVDEDRDNFIDAVTALEQTCGHSVIHSTIPLFSNNAIVRELTLQQLVRNFVPYFDRLDYSRDGFHYDHDTAQWVAERMAQIITHKY